VHVLSNGRQSPTLNTAAVIPGRREAMSPESIVPRTQAAKWIPGSMSHRPGMTVEKNPPAIPR